MKNVIFLIYFFLLSHSHALTWFETNSFICIEVESVSTNADWVANTNISGYTGSSYYEWDGSFNWSAGTGILRYEIYISKPGNYQFNWHSRICEGSSSTDNNDSWLRMSGIPVSGEEPIEYMQWHKVYMNNLGSWSWNALTVDHVGEPIRQYFSAGQHVIEISARSSHHGLDRFVLFEYEEKPWEFNGWINGGYYTTLNTLTESPTSLGSLALSNLVLSPNAVSNFSVSTLTFDLYAMDTNGSFQDLYADLSSLGDGSNVSFIVLSSNHFQAQETVPAGNPGGIYILPVTVIDSNGLVFHLYQSLAVHDNTPPGTNIITNAVFSGSSTVRLSWTEAHDETGINSYFIVKGTNSGMYTVTNAVGTALSTIDSQMINGRDHYFALFCSDTSGNLSQLSEEYFYSQPTGPAITNITLASVNFTNDLKQTLDLSVSIQPGMTNIAQFYADLSSLGLSATYPLSNTGDSITWQLTAEIPLLLPAGTKNIPLTLVDNYNYNVSSNFSINMIYVIRPKPAFLYEYEGEFRIFSNPVNLYEQDTVYFAGGPKNISITVFTLYGEKIIELPENQRQWNLRSSRQGIVAGGTYYIRYIDLDTQSENIAALRLIR